jgi:two-component system sensor histidine kinase RegB
MSNKTAPVVLTSLCLRYLLLLRTIAMGGQLAALTAAHLLLGADLPLGPMAAIIVPLALYTAVSWRQVNGGAAVTEQTILVQLLADTAALAILLYFTGGSWNPFVSLFLLPITVAAATLRPAYTWLLVLLAAACYTVLMFFHVNTLHWGHGGSPFSLHVWGMWLGFLLAAGVVAYFVAGIGATLRAHDRALAEARQLIALGTLAAGTAHELGTPLATVAVLAKELEHSHGDDATLIGDLRVLRGEIDRCKEILSRMADQTGQVRADAGHRVELDRYLNDLIEEWRALRPEARANLRLTGHKPAPSIIADRTLSQTLLNIFNNAADASPLNVDIEGVWDEQELRVLVRDRGPGVPEHIRGHLGEAFVTTKKTGMGLGLYLARSTLNRLGGQFTLNDSDGGRKGTTAEVRLPLKPLLAA